jgi:hypothetical protein
MAGIGLVFIGMGVATTASAEDWRACVVGACLKGYCGDSDASVVVSMATDVSDPAIGGPEAMQRALLGSLQQRGQVNGEPMMSCTPSQPSESAATQLSQNIFAQMSTSFYDVRLVSANDLVNGYDSVPGSEDPDYNGGSSNAGNDYASPASDDNGAAQAQAEAAAREREAAEAQADRDRRDQEAAAAMQAQRDREAQIAAQREQDRIAQETRRAEQQAAAEELRKKMDERNKASTDTDANQCVSSASIRHNDTFQGNTAAYVTNGCGTPVDVRVCLMTEAKGWNCGMTWGLSSQSSWSHSSFNATGQVFVDARVSGSSRPLNSP